MKNILFLAIAVLLFSCENNKPKTETTVIKDSVITGPEKKETGKDLTKLSGELEILTPLDEATMKGKLPLSLLGGERTSVETSNSTGALSADATYKINDSTSLDLSILDCGGPAGSGFFNVNYISSVENGLTADDAVVVKSEFNGFPAFELSRNKESGDNAQHDHSFTFFNGTRFLVNLNGKNLSIEKLKEAAGQLKL